MNQADLMALMPIIILTIAAAAMMFQIAWNRRHLITAGMAMGACAAALVCLPLAAPEGARRVMSLLMIDGYALFYMGVILATTLAVVAMSLPYLLMRPSDESQPEEFYVLLLLATIGACVLVAADHVASFFLGLELISLSLYGLIGYLRARLRSLEAAIKYLVLSAASSAFLLFGLALLYVHSGTMEFSRIGTLQRIEEGVSLTVLAAFGFILIGVGFKLGVAPFHMWAPDVYQGAPAPVAAFVATCSKAAVFALLLRLTVAMDLERHAAFWNLIAIVAVLSMFGGNLLALFQSDVKRILAYSSIAHLGYALVAFLAGGSLAVESVTVYLTAYVLTSLGAFTVVALLSTSREDADPLDRYQGLFWRRPWMCAAMMVMLLSLAGIPLTVGFIGKFYAIAAGVGSGLWILLIILVTNSVIGLFYYLRILVVMLQPASSAVQPIGTRSDTRYLWIGSTSLAVVTLLAVWIGVNPEPLIRVVRMVVVGKL
jgi:NADH-quinone oxidoreductase subunit N